MYQTNPSGWNLDQKCRLVYATSFNHQLKEQFIVSKELQTRDSSGGLAWFVQPIQRTTGSKYIDIHGPC